MATLRDMFKRGGPIAALTALVLVAAPAAGATPGTDATDWLVSELQPTPASDPAYCDSFSPAGIVGQSIDCMLAFKAAGAAYDDERDATYDYVIANMEDYVGDDPCSTTTDPLSAAAVAKLALGVLARGVDQPTNIGGRNLIADLQCLQAGSGRFSDKNQTDFSNVFGQSIAIVALKACQANCSSPPGGLATTIANGASYLRGQQCSGGTMSLNGAFRSPLGLAANACNATSPFPSSGPPNPNAVDVDSTGLAVGALFAEGSFASTLAGISAGSWLGAQAQFPSPFNKMWWRNYCDFGDPDNLYPSVNSTALAIMGYVEAGLTITQAQAWLADAVANGGDNGLPACGASGAGDVLATAQGVMGLYGVSYAQLAGI
jgi:hypothetical protein